MEWKWKKFKELTVDELYEVIFLRQNIFILDQQCRYEDLDYRDQPSHHLLGYRDQKLVAYLRVLPPGLKYDEVSIGRVVNSLEVRKLGIGKELMSTALKNIKNLYGEASIRISAQLYLTKFYQEFGFMIVGTEYLEDDIPHIEMLRRS